MNISPVRDFRHTASNYFTKFIKKIKAQYKSFKLTIFKQEKIVHTNLRQKSPVCAITRVLHSNTTYLQRKKGAKLPRDELSLESDERRKDG